MLLSARRYFVGSMKKYILKDLSSLRRSQTGLNTAFLCRMFRWRWLFKDHPAATLNID